MHSLWPWMVASEAVCDRFIACIYSVWGVSCVGIECVYVTEVTTIDRHLVCVSVFPQGHLHNV